MSLILPYKDNLPRKEIPKGQGVYIFWAKKKPLYIGSTGNLPGRLAWHVHTYKLRSLGCTHVEIITDFNGKPSYSLERELILKMKPYMNVQCLENLKKIRNEVQ